MTRHFHKSRQARSGGPNVLGWRGVMLSVLACVLVVAAVGRPAQAVTINVVYDSLLSQPPANDPAGDELTRIVNAAGDYWEQILTDPVTINVFIHWKAALAKPTTIATAWLTGEDDNGKPSTGLIDFNRQMDFYYDQTPDNNNEYNMGQWFYRDLEPTQQSTWYTGSPPPVLEHCHGGLAADTAPVEAQDDLDLFTVAVHELGHILGMNGTTNWLEVLDGDYDISPAAIGGATAGIVNDDNHLLVENALMDPSIDSGVRILPSATDIFAIATSPIGDWSGVELPRREFLGGVDLNNDSAWIGGERPGVNDSASVRVNGGGPPMASTTAYMIVGDLNILEGSWVTTNYVFEVAETATIDGSGAPPGGSSRIRVQSSGSLETTDLVVGPDAVLDVLGGYVEVDDEAQVAAGGLIQGNGMMFVQGRLTSDGLIRVDAPLLTLSTFSGGAKWDLDGAGAGAGELEVIDGNMYIFGAHIGSFHGTATVGAGRRLEFAHPWWFGDNGDLTLDGGPAGPATLLSTDSRLRGNVVVNGTGIVDGMTTFQGPVQVSIPTAADMLELHGDVIFDGGSYTGDGTIKQMGDVDVDSNTSVDVTIYDWGNSTILQPIQTTVGPGATFSVNSPTTGGSINSYHGTMLVSGGVLDVNTDSFWTLAEPTGSPWYRSGGTLDMIESGGQPARVQGQPLMVQHRIDAIAGTNIIEADLTTTAAAEIQVRSGADLQLAGHTKLSGGNIHGEGTLSQHGDITAMSDTVIDTDVFDWGNSTGATTHTLTVGPGVRLNVMSPTTGDGANSFRGAISVDSGTLAANMLDPWTLAAPGVPTLPQGVLTLTRTGPEKPTITGIASMQVAGALDIDADEAFFESTMVLQGGKVTFLADGEMQHVAPVQFVAGAIDHTTRAGWFRTSPSARLAWAAGANITVQGNSGGSLTFDLASGTAVSVPATAATLTIDPGATVDLAGATDPFTDSVVPTRHVDVVNDSTTSLNIIAGAKAVGTLSGVGNTFIAPGAGLAAAAVDQNRVTIAAGGSLDISLFGSSIQVGDVLDNAGLVSFSGSISVTGDVLNSGEINVPTRSTAQFLGPVSGNGRFTGPGTVEFHSNVAPGESIDTWSFEGDVMLGGSAVLEIELGGTPDGTDDNRDQIIDMATIMLVGGPTLEILPWNSFVPEIGDEFVILTAWMGLSGLFGNTVVDPWFAAQSIGFDLHYNIVDGGMSDLTLEAVLGLLKPGDADGDGDVDLDDFSAMKNGFGTGTTLAEGDFDGDHDVDLDDFMILKNNFGTATIPEPATLALLALGGLTAARRRR